MRRAGCFLALKKYSEVLGDTIKCFLMKEKCSRKAFRMHSTALGEFGRIEHRICCLEWGIAYFGVNDPDVQIVQAEVVSRYGMGTMESSWTCSHCKDFFDVAAFKCGGCLVTRYCSKDCQKKAWPAHKKYCHRQIELNASDERDQAVMRTYF